MADVILTLTWDETLGDGGYHVTLPDGRAFETGDRFAWPTKERAEEAVRDHFATLRGWIGSLQGSLNADRWIAYGARVGQSGADVEADLRLIGIDPATGVDVAAEAGATHPQRPDDAGPYREAIARRLEALGARRLALSVEMLEVQGAIEALRGQVLAFESISDMLRVQSEATRMYEERARELGIEIGSAVTGQKPGGGA